MSSRLQQTAAWIILALLGVASVRSYVFNNYLLDREALRPVYDNLFDRGVPAYPDFLRGVAARTKPGDSIAIFVPMRRWDDGYAYAYYRAHWFLAGRNVVPVVWRDDRILEENLKSARYVASWKVSLRMPDLKPVAQFAGGTLYERTP